MTRRIRVGGVPADFRVPRGWPVPTDRWVRTNALWIPPVGWTPLPGLEPAPRNWRYWSPNPLWHKTRGHVYRVPRMWGHVGGIALLGSAATRWWAHAAQVPDAVVTSLGILSTTVVFASLIGYISTHRSATHRALVRHAIGAAEGRTERLTREYQRYLLDLS